MNCQHEFVAAMGGITYCKKCGLYQQSNVVITTTGTNPYITIQGMPVTEPRPPHIPFRG